MQAVDRQLVDKKSVGYSKDFKKLSQGFTLVELLVVVVIIGILAAIALPNYIGAQAKSKTAAIRGNMRTVQIASEAYSTDSGGVYAPAVASVAPYFPGGSYSVNGTAGVYPTNPITGKTNETPGTSSTTTSALIATKRTTNAASVTVATKGMCTFDQADTGLSYAVMGSDPNGNAVAGQVGYCLVLSNQ